MNENRKQTANPSILVLLFYFAASPTAALSGLKAQTWSPWSPHHQPLFRQPHSSTTQPIRRASMMSTKSDDENYIFLLGKKHRKLNTFSHSLNMECNSSDSMENVSIKSNPFWLRKDSRPEESHGSAFLTQWNTWISHMLNHEWIQKSDNFKLWPIHINIYMNILVN